VITENNHNKQPQKCVTTHAFQKITIKAVQYNDLNAVINCSRRKTATAKKKTKRNLRL